MGETIRLGSRKPTLLDRAKETVKKTAFFLAATNPLLAVQKAKRTSISPFEEVGKSIALSGLIASGAGALPIVTAVKLAGASVLGGGILATSPTAQKFIKEKLKDVTAGGRFVGKTIEDVATGKTEEENGKTFGEKLKEGLKAAGLIGLGAAGAAGIITAIKKIKGTPIPTFPTLESSIPAGNIVSSPAFIGGTPNAISRVEIPVEKPVTAVKPAKPMNITQNVNVKVTSKPTLSSKASISRRFINNIYLK